MVDSIRSHSLSSMHGKDFVELVWENGPILVQGSGPSSNKRTEHEDAAAAAASRVYSILNHDHDHQVNPQRSSSCFHIDGFQFSQGKNHSILQQQEPASSRSLEKDSKVTTWGSPLKKKPRLGCDHRTGYKVNFPNFVVPALFLKSANQNPPKNNNHSSLARVEEVERTVAAAATTSSKSNDHCSQIESANKRLKGFQDQTSMTPNKCNPASQHVDEHSEAVRRQGCHGQQHSQTSISGAAATKAKGAVANNNIELCNEPLLPSSSVCSLGASNNPNICIRLHGDTTTDDSTNLSDNDEETEDNAVKETPPREGTRVKRSRNPEIHNLSEKTRREKINKKIRTLRELIPNCNKTDKASMLDDAIDYLKTLKLQLQIMSMGGGLCMPFMMLPHLQLAHQLMGGAAGMCFRPGTAGIPCSPPQFPIPPLPAITDSSTLSNMFGNFSSQMRHPIPPVIPMTGNLPTPPLMPTNMVENLANFVQLTNLEASMDSSGHEGKARTM